MTSPSTILVAIFFVAAASTMRPDSQEPALKSSTSPGSDAPRFDLPPGPAADAVLVITPTTKAHATPSDLGASGDVPAYPNDAWSKPATWTAWGGLVAAEKSGSSKAMQPPDPERRARLALLALEQGRSDEAWAHLAATRSDPTWTAAILPRFLPGVPPKSASASGGYAAPLEDGAILTPSLPPPTRATDSGTLDRRAMSARSIAIGAAVVSMKVSVENEGVQIDVRHVSGGPAHLSIRIPEPRDFTFGNEYVDWYRQDDMHVPHAFEVKPGEEEHTLYGRFEARGQPSSTHIPDLLPAAMTLGGLWLVSPDDAGRPLLAAVAQSLSNVLGVTCKLRAPSNPPYWTGISVDLAVPAERTLKLAWLASAVERFTLTPR